jgi:hypothetical protein
VRGVAADVVWATYRLVALNDQFAPASDTQFDHIFEQLRWGTAEWVS